MKLIKVTKDSGKHVWINMEQIVSFQEAGRDIIIVCASNMGYRLECPSETEEPEKVKEFNGFLKLMETKVVFTSKASIE